MHPARNGTLPKESPKCFYTLGPVRGLRMNELKVWLAIKVSPNNCLESDRRSCSQSHFYFQASPSKYQ